MGDAIYQSNWYTWPVNLQKDMIHLMNRKQNGVRLSIGPFATLNNECCYAVGFILVNLSSFYIC